MKKLILSAILCLSMASLYAQSFTFEGDTFTAVKSSSATKDTLVTQYKWADSKGNKYPIVVRKENGYCYVCRTSGKTGKFYRQAIPEDVAKAVCQKVGIAYTYEKKSKK